MNDANDFCSPTLPLVRTSVAMCTFNGETYLREQIESILRQSVGVGEIVVADDASTDRTRALLERYRDERPHLFRLFFRDTNSGAIDNFGFAVEQCRGEVIFLCDQDDVWQPRKVELALEHFRGPRCLMLFTDGRTIDSTGERLNLRLWQHFRFSHFRRFLWRRVPGAACLDLLNNNNKVTGATVALHKRLLTHALPIPLLPDGYWHDAWFALHAAANDGLEFAADCLIDYRIHERQQVGIKTGIGVSSRPTIPHWEFFNWFNGRYPVVAKRAMRLRVLQDLRARVVSRK